MWPLPIHVISWLAWSSTALVLATIAAVNVWVQWFSHVQKILLCASLTLDLTVFLLSLLWCFLGLGREGCNETFIYGLTLHNREIYCPLYIVHMWVFDFLAAYCTRKLLWWGLRAALKGIYLKEIFFFKSVFILLLPLVCFVLFFRLSLPGQWFKAPIGQLRVTFLSSLMTSEMPE